MSTYLLKVYDIKDATVLSLMASVMEVVPMDESYKAAPKKYLVPVVFDKNDHGGTSEREGKIL